MMARRQLYIFGSIFVVVLAVLAIVYFAILRVDYVPLFENLREGDASAIVGELDKQSIDYQLANEGHDILVPEPSVGQARLALAGSNIAVGGVVGFELFNESDMGLTEFAQKINYQRALQGELARTIMMMEGIKFARVHLALSEKTIFRAAQTAPTAAVTIQTVSGGSLGADRVAGIQQLVASAVPDLPLNNVAILDDRGDLLNQVSNGTETGAVADEKTALEQYFRVRAQAIITQLIPGLGNEVKIFATQRGQAVNPDANIEDAAAKPLPSSSEPNARNFGLRVLVRTATALNGEDSELLRSAIADGLALQLGGGDELAFEVGQLGFTPGVAPAMPSEPMGGDSLADASAQSVAPPMAWMDYILNRWFLLLLFVVAVVGIVLWRQRQQLNEEEQQSFADMLADSLSTQQAQRNAD